MPTTCHQYSLAFSVNICRVWTGVIPIDNYSSSEKTNIKMLMGCSVIFTFSYIVVETQYPHLCRFASDYLSINSNLISTIIKLACNRFSSFIRLCHLENSYMNVSFLIPTCLRFNANFCRSNHILQFEVSFCFQPYNKFSI